MGISDTFTGSNGDAPDAAKWTTYVTSGSTVDIQSNQLRLATGTLGSYSDRAQATSDAAASSYFRVTLDVTPQGSGESYFEVPFRAATNGTSIDQDCYKFEIGSWGGVALIKVVNWSATSLGSSGISGYGAGTTVHVDYEVSGSTLTAYAWTGGGGRPGSPTVQVTDSAIAGPGYTGLFLVGGAATAATDWRVDDYNLTTGDATATPSVVAAVAAVPAPTVSAGSTVTPSSVAATAATPAPTLHTGSTVTPAVAAAVAAVPAPTVKTGSTVTPAVVAAAAGVGTATLQTGSTVTGVTVAAVAAVPAPSVISGSSVTVSPSTVAAVAAVLAPTLSTGQRVNPAVVAATAAVGSLSVVVATVVSPATVVAVASVPAATLHGGSTVTAQVVAAYAQVLAPIIGAAAAEGVIAGGLRVGPAMTGRGGSGARIAGQGNGGATVTGGRR